MTPIRTTLSVILAVLLCAAAAWAQAQAHIKLVSKAEVEQVSVGTDGNKQVQRQPATKVLPGSRVIFTTEYENTSKQAAENAVITNPMPEHMIYVDGSAEGINTRITFSVDKGKSFAVPTELFLYDSAGRKYPALAKDYTHIRWTMERPLPPGAKGEVSFQAILQ
jgi:uncharacterized repeat protein (TIGR01451 family)